MSRLGLVVGPNGAGKSTFVRFVLAPNRPGVPFVNADIIARERWPEDPEGRSYEAAETAGQVRAALIQAGEEFIAETVFSHPSKLELVDHAVTAAYDVHLHVLMVPVELSIARVAARVATGEHDVRENKIRKRHDRLWALVADAAGRARRTSFWDNTGESPVLIAVRGQRTWSSAPPGWPWWVHPDLPSRLGGTVDSREPLGW
ncbi:MAG TPA: AAA family ATPase [Euzebya sp.]|nr:AAA family ATPase [Euzebya sp.]